MFDKKKKDDKIKTMHAIGKTDFKSAKKELDIALPKDEARKPITTKARQLLLSVCAEVLKKHETVDIEKILEKIQQNYDVKTLLRLGKISDDDILEALEDVTKTLVEE